MSEKLRVAHWSGTHWPDTTCRLDVLQEQPPVAMVTEIASNRGASVTNAAEGIAKALIDRFGEDVVIIEHYDRGSYKGGRGGADTWDLVQWQRQSDGRIAIRWRHLPVGADRDVMGKLPIYQTEMET